MVSVNAVLILYRTQKVAEKRETAHLRAIVKESTKEQGGDFEVLPYDSHSEFACKL